MIVEYRMLYWTCPNIKFEWPKSWPLTARSFSPQPVFDSWPGHVIKLPASWGKAVVFARYCSFLHLLQIASHDLHGRKVKVIVIPRLYPCELDKGCPLASNGDILTLKSRVLVVLTSMTTITLICLAFDNYDLGSRGTQLLFPILGSLTIFGLEELHG